MAQTCYALCRGDHRLRVDDRRALSNHSPWAAAVFLLAGALSERKRPVAELSFAACLGLLRHQHLPARIYYLFVSSAYPRSRVVARQITGLASTSLRHVEPWLERNTASMGQARARSARDGCCDHPCRGFSAHDSLVGLCDDHSPDVALDDVRSLFCRRRDLFGNRCADSGDGSHQTRVSSRELSSSSTFQQPWLVAAHDEPDLVLLHFRGVFDIVVRERA